MLVDERTHRSQLMHYVTRLRHSDPKTARKLRPYGDKWQQVQAIVRGEVSVKGWPMETMTVTDETTAVGTEMTTVETDEIGTEPMGALAPVAAIVPRDLPSTATESETASEEARKKTSWVGLNMRTSEEVRARFNALKERTGENASDLIAHLLATHDALQAGDQGAPVVIEKIVEKVVTVPAEDTAARELLFSFVEAFAGTTLIAGTAGSAEIAFDQTKALDLFLTWAHACRLLGIDQAA